MTRTPKRPQPRPAAPAAAPESATPATPPDPQAVLLAAALETLQLEALPESVHKLATACGPLVTPERWGWPEVQAYQLVHRLLTDRATARRLARQQQEPAET